MTQDIEKSLATLKGIPTQEQLLERLKYSVVEVTFTKLNGGHFQHLQFPLFAGDSFCRFSF